MKTLLSIAALLVLAGCVSVPVERKFPETPPSLKQQCPDLKLVPSNTTKLSDVLTVVTTNYTQYNECQITVESWNEWYNIQKKIFEQAN